MSGLVSRGLRVLLSLALVVLLLLLSINLWLTGRAQSRMAQNPDACQGYEVAVVFGTSRYLRSGQMNPHYYGRIQLAARLYHQGQIRHLLLSGDHQTPFYNEPRRMQQSLLALGVPAQAMTLDSAGLSTFDTLKRAQVVYRQQRLLLVTQAYHLPRALFIADHLGLDALGCAAASPDWSDMRSVWLREVLARVAVWGDLYLWQRHDVQVDDLQPLVF